MMDAKTRVISPAVGRQSEACVESSCFDETYVAKLRDGDPATQEHFVSYFRRPIRLKAWRHLKERGDVDDICQETLLRVLQHFRSGKRLESAERLPAFVHSVCHNVAMEACRARTRHPQIPDNAEDPVDSQADVQRKMLTEERRRLVLGILLQLPDKDRELLRHALLQDADRAELCRRFETNQGYLRVLLCRARRRFRAALQTCRPECADALAAGGHRSGPHLANGVPKNIS